MSRSKKNRLNRLLAEMTILHKEKLGHRGRTKMYVCDYPKLGCKVAVLHKKEDAMFRDGLPLNDAAKAGALCWMLDSTIIPILEAKHGIKFVLFYQDLTEDIYVSRLEDWQDDSKRYIPQNPNAQRFQRHAVSVRHMSVRHMWKSAGNPSILTR